MSQESKIIYRLTYTKGDKVKYISHLDFLRCVNRSFKRAHIPVKYSQGFNPHILLNIALPCPVGVSSECEMLDIELTRTMEPDKIVHDLNEVMPVGIRILSAEKKDMHRDFFDIEKALYEIEFKSSKEFNPDDFLNAETVVIEKKSKRGMKEVNLKDFIFSAEIIPKGDCKYSMNAVIAAGNKSNLKPELMLSAMADFYGASFSDIYTVRKQIYFEN